MKWERRINPLKFLHFPLLERYSSASEKHITPITSAWVHFCSLNNRLSYRGASGLGNEGSYNVGHELSHSHKGDGGDESSKVSTEEAMMETTGLGP